MQNKDRIGIGDNGVGKPTLLNLIAAWLQPQSGQVIIGETVRVAYFLQQIDGLDESKRGINFLQEAAEEVKTTVGTTSIADFRAISLPTFHAWNLDRRTLRWWEEALSFL